VNEPSQIAILAGRALNVPVIVSVAGGELIGLWQIDYGGQLGWIERTMVRWPMRAADSLPLAARQEVLSLTYNAHPERFVKRPPAPEMLPAEVWMNRPQPLLALPPPDVPH
jgi:hypothetical protein